MNFIEIGSNDYDTMIHSNFFSKNSWGIVIEPLSKFLDNLEKVDNVQYLNYAVTPEHDGYAKFYAPIDDPDPWWIKSTGSLQPDHPTIKELGISGQTVETTVQTMSLDSLYKLIPSDCIHCLKIDTEGSDFDLLMAWNFAKFKPLHIQFESKLMSKIELQALTNHLIDNDYSVVKGNKKDYNQNPYNHIAILEL